jgi:hypothetical protein
LGLERLASSKRLSKTGEQIFSVGIVGGSEGSMESFL